MAVIACHQVYQVYARTPIHVTGYDEAARYVIQNSKSPVTLIDGVNEALFVYFMRSLDPGKSMYVLRGRQVLSTSVFSETTFEVHAKSREELTAIFDRYGIEYIVVEREKLFGVSKIHQTLRNFLDEGPFELAKAIPIQSHSMKWKGQSLRIYRYLEPKPVTANDIEIRLPAVGLTVKGPIVHLRGDQTER